MARRSTTKTTGRNAPREASAEEAPPTPRRRGKATSPKSPPAEPSVADAFFPGGEDAVPETPELDLEVTEPVKPRRGRQSKAKPPVETTAPEAAADETADAPGIEADTVDATPDNKPDDLFAEPAEAPAATATESVDESAPASPSAAHWDAATGSVTFDWAVIEQVASGEGANQPMAKLLLAARAEGARSRWPF